NGVDGQVPVTGRKDARKRAGTVTATRAELGSVAQLLERSPPLVGGRVLVLVRLGVQVATAHGAEPRAVLAAEDLVRQLQRDRIARPRGQVDAVVLDVRAPQLLGGARARRLVLARADRELEDGVGEASIAGPVEASCERELEDGSRAGPRQMELGRHP